MPPDLIQLVTFKRVRIVAALAAVACALLASGAHAPAQDAASAQQFVRSLYRLYTKDGPGVPFSGPKSRLYYHSSLLALMRADDMAAGPGYVGVLDSDPICMCQDFEGIWNLNIAIQSVGADRAVARVSFSLNAPGENGPDETRTLLMTLAAEHGQWRIWNIRDDSDPRQPFDECQSLESEIRKLTKPRKPAR